MYIYSPPRVPYRNQCEALGGSVLSYRKIPVPFHHRRPKPRFLKKISHFRNNAPGLAISNYSARKMYFLRQLCENTGICCKKLYLTRLGSYVILIAAYELAYDNYNVIAVHSGGNRFFSPVQLAASNQQRQKHRRIHLEQETDISNASGGRDASAGERICRFGGRFFGFPERLVGSRSALRRGQRPAERRERPDRWCGPADPCADGRHHQPRLCREKDRRPLRLQRCERGCVVQKRPRRSGCHGHLSGRERSAESGPPHHP